MPQASDAPTRDLTDAEAMALVDRYLALCQERQLTAASEMLVDQPVLVFPGGVRHADLAAMVAEAGTRYAWVAKTRMHTAAGVDAEGRRVVTHSGTLHGENLHGVAFSGVRYLDLFVLDGERIAEQHVFNDLAASDVLTRTEAPPDTR